MEQWTPAAAKETDRWIKAIVEALTGPLVMHPGGWHESLPAWVREQARIERLVAAKDGDWDMATDAEVVAYLYTAGLTAPLSYEHTEIYCYLVAKYKPELRDVPSIEVVDELGRWFQQVLDDLKRQIRQAQKRRR